MRVVTLRAPNTDGAFAIALLNACLRRYRMSCVKYQYPVDGSSNNSKFDGPRAGVFLNHLPEVVLDMRGVCKVGSESPLVDSALGCSKGMLVILTELRLALEKFRLGIYFHSHEKLAFKTSREHTNYLLSAEDRNRGRVYGKGQEAEQIQFEIMEDTRDNIQAEYHVDKEVNMAAGDSDDALVCCVKNTVEDRIMDSGASFHATYCKEELEMFKLRSGKVRLADDKTLDIASIGDVVLKTSFSTSWTLKDVRWFGEAEEAFLHNVREDKETVEVGAIGIAVGLMQTFRAESTGLRVEAPKMLWADSFSTAYLIYRIPYVPIGLRILEEEWRGKYTSLAHLKVFGTMAGVDVDTLTMEQYLALSRENQAPGVVKPKIGGNVNFKIKSQFMRELREDTFSGNKYEDAHDHIDRVLSIVGLCNIPGVSKDAVMLRVFPFTLTGSAKSRNIGSSSSKDGLAALVNKLDNLGRDMKKLKESVHAIQVGCQICKGPHLDKDCPLNEEVKQVEDVRFREFGPTTPFKGNNVGKFRVGPPGYYTKIDNRPPYGEKRQSLEELLAKHQEESA
ncbi:hypothetical protein Tco_1352217 [Tanacetum coccineum]